MPLWRHPVLAPGYAAAIAFGAVALASVVVTPDEGAAGTKEKVTVTVTSASAADAGLLTGLTVQVRDDETVLATGPTDAEGRWSQDVTAGDHEVCVVAAAGPVRLAGSNPASACARERMSADRTTELTVERVQVVAETTDDDHPLPSGGKVTIRLGRQALKGGALDQTGRLTPSELPLNAEVCLDPPAGWRLAGTETDGQQCRAVTNPAADVLFRLEAS
ncbi:hypothetical protein [Pseudofrankia asymbiotica]|uniref:hypothetical protein n=1 Tax=Pseudofrankia asymbiotica TaxID=1834516 RepID=UPI001F51C77F|nr:hypothetical protein [Pseudofrankia asymbiotica]